MYAQGNAPKDAEAAFIWTTRATLAGDNRGRELLGMLQAQLSAEQIRLATDPAREPHPKPGVLRARSR